MSLVVRLISTLFPMVILHWTLVATGPAFVFYIFLGSACFLPLLPPRIGRPLGLVFFCLGAVVAFTLIVIQPLSGFLVWFELVESRAMRGPISLVFLYLGGYLSLAASFETRPGRRLKPLVQVLLVNSFLGYMIFRLAWLIALAGLLLPVLLVTALSEKPIPRFRRRGLANLAGLSLLAATTAFVTMPGEAPEGIYLIDKHLSVLLRGAVFRLLPEFPVLYGFSGYGHGFPEDRLGGRPLLSGQALFAIEGTPGSTLYLRTKAFDHFAGNGWILSSSHPDRQGTGVLRSVSNRRGAPTYTDRDTTPEEPAREERLQLRLLMDYYPELPQLLGKTTLIPGRMEEGLVYRGGFATGLSLERPLLYGEQVVIVSDSTSGMDDPSLYLNTPPQIDPAVQGLADTLRGLPGAEILPALESLLDEGFTYSLDVEEPKASADGSERPDFLRHFLFESRTGYCVHFATAATMLARLAGIPARYVSGFLATIPRPEDDFLDTGSDGISRTEITGLQSHAWTELWLESEGWITFEATPPLRPTVSGTRGFRTTSDDDYTLRQLTAIGFGRPELPQAGVPGRGTLIKPAWYALLLMVLPLMVLAGVYFYPWKTQPLWSRSLGFIRYLVLYKVLGWVNAGPQDFSLLAGRAVRLASTLGIPGPERTGWLAWEKDVEGRIRSFITEQAAQNGDSLEAGFGVNIFREVFFGFRPLEDRDFKTVDTLVRLLRAASLRNYT